MGNKIRFGGAHKWAEMLHHPSILGGPQEHGEQNQNLWGPQVGRNATSPLHSRGSPQTWGTKSDLVGPTSGQKCYVTPPFSGVPEDMGNKIRIGGAHKWAEMLHHPCILGDPQRHGEQNQIWWGPQVGRNATSPLHSRGSARTWGTKSDLVGPTSGRKCYITPAFSGIPTNMGDKIRFGGAHKWAEMLRHPSILGGAQEHGEQNQNWWGPQVGGNATSPLYSRGSPQRHGEQNQIWCRPQVGENATSPLHSRGSPKTWGTKSELVGPTSGRKCYITPVFSGISSKTGGKNQIWWGPQVGGNATSPLHSRGSARTWGTKSELVGPTSGRKCYITPVFSGISSKTWGTKSDLVGPTSGRKCYITPAFSVIPKDMGDQIRFGGAHKWAEMLHHPSILGGPQEHGEQNQNWWGPKMLHHPCNLGDPLKNMENKIRFGGAHKWAEMLHHPCILGGPQKHGEQNPIWWGPQVGGNATSPLYSRGSPKTWGTKSELVGPTSGWKCYITPAFSGIPKDMENKIRIGGAHKWAEMLHHPCILGGPQKHGEQNPIWWGPQVGGNATSPLYSRGSPKTWGTKSELVGPTSGRKCYITPVFSGIPAKTWGTKSELVGPTSGRKCYITPVFSGIPKDMGNKIRIGGAHKWAEMLHHPCILGDPQRHGEQNQNWWGPQVGRNATSPLHSRRSPKTWGTKSNLVGPTSGRKCYITPAFSGIPKDMGNKIRIGGAHKWAEMLHHPCILGDPQRHGGQNQNWWGPQVGGNATSPLHSRGSPKRHGGQNQNWWSPQVGGNATSPLHSRGSPKTWGTKSELVGPTSRRKCYITPAFSGIPKDVGDKIRIGGAHKWAEMLHHPCILGDPQRHGGQNQIWWGPQVGRNATSPLHSRRSARTWGTKSELVGPGNATSPLHSRGSPKTWGTKSELVGPTSGRKCYITPAFSGIPSKTWGTKSDLVGPTSGRKCYINPAFSAVPKNMGNKIQFGGAHKWAEMLHHPCILGDPQRHGEQNQNWWGPQVGGNATSPLHSRGSPKTWRTKSELVGPTSGQKCYITPAFSAVPKNMGNKIQFGGAHKWAEMLHHPCILGDPQRHGEQNQNWWGPQVGGNATSPLYSRGSPQRHGEQNQNWWGPQVGGNATSPLYSRGSPKTWGTKSELVGPTSGRKCYITPAFSGIPKDMENKIRIGGAHKWAEMLHHPCILGGPQKHGEQNPIWWGPQVGGNATSPLHSPGSPKTWGTKSELVGPTSGRKCYITPVFSGIPKDMGDKIRIGGAHKWAEMLHHPCILGDPPKTWGTKSELVEPTSGRKCYITPAFSGIPKDMGDKIRIGGAHKSAEMLHHPCILGDPQRHGGFGFHLLLGSPKKLSILSIDT